MTEFALIPAFLIALTYIAVYALGRWHGKSSTVKNGDGSE